MVIVYVLAAWNDFSFSWGLSKTNFGVLKVASGCGRKKGFCVAWIVMVSHTVLYVFEFMVILSILHTLILNSTLVLFSSAFWAR